jgi:hypothetical protein
MKLYLAGPMRGYPEFNFPAFHAAAARLRIEGHEVFSPAEHAQERVGEALYQQKDGNEDELAKRIGVSTMELRRKVFADDLGWICAEADGVALLPGWETSKGANAEKAAAEALGLEVIYLAE